MRNIILSMLLLFMFNSISYTQGISLQFGGNYASYKMSDLKNLQDQITNSIISRLEIPFKETDRFPSYFTIEAELIFNPNKSVGYGIVYNFSLTGARSYYEDYSGSYKNDYGVSANSFGLLIEYNLSPIDVSFGTKLFYTVTDFNLVNDLNAYSQTQSEKLEAVTSSIDFNPYFALQKSFSDFYLKLSCGYLFSFSQDLHKNDNADAYLLNSDNQRMEVDWSGMRIGLNIGYRFHLSD